VRPQHSRLVRCLDHSPSLRRAKPEACWGLQGWGICGCRCLCVCVCGGGGGETMLTYLLTTLLFTDWTFTCHICRQFQTLVTDTQSNCQ
jgi:hypothetical protein